jgi:hypothetical protein
MPVLVAAEAIGRGDGGSVADRGSGATAAGVERGVGASACETVKDEENYRSPRTDYYATLSMAKELAMVASLRASQEADRRHKDVLEVTRKAMSDAGVSSQRSLG